MHPAIRNTSRCLQFQLLLKPLSSRGNSIINLLRLGALSHSRWLFPTRLSTNNFAHGSRPVFGSNTGFGVFLERVSYFRCQLSENCTYSTNVDTMGNSALVFTTTKDIHRLVLSLALEVVCNLGDSLSIGRDR